MLVVSYSQLVLYHKRPPRYDRRSDSASSLGQYKFYVSRWQLSASCVPAIWLLTVSVAADLPTQALLYSPPAIPVYLAPLKQQPQPARSLFPAFGMAAQLPASPAVTAARTSDPTQATILPAQGRHDAPTEFLHCCRLLVHHDTRLQLTDPATGQPLGQHAHLFPRQPTLHF